MADVIDLVVRVGGLLAIVVLNSVVAALMTRFFRVRLSTAWGSLLYALVLCPVVLLLIVFVLSGPLGLGADVGSPALAVLLTVVGPLAIGLTFDYFWMPDPDEVDLPETT